MLRAPRPFTLHPDRALDVTTWYLGLAAPQFEPRSHCIEHPGSSLVTPFRAHRSRPYSVHSRRTNSWHEPAAFLPCLGIDQASRRPRWIAIQLCYHLWLLLLARLCYIYRRWLASPLALTTAQRILSRFFCDTTHAAAKARLEKTKPALEPPRREESIAGVFAVF